MTLHYRLQLSLEDIALRKVVVMLWNKMEVLSQVGVIDLESFWVFKNNLDVLSQVGVINLEPFWNFKKEFDKDLVRVKNKLSELKLPKILLNKELPLIENIGLEILNWLNFHFNLLKFQHTYFERETNIYININFDTVLEKLSWTSVGTINYQKTAEELIQCGMFDNFLLFKLACIYCLEDQVTVLWERLPGPTKNKFYNKKDLFQLTQPQLDAFWTSFFRYEDDVSMYMFRQTFDNIPNFYQHVFEVAANLGSLAATEYFYRKLTREEKENSLLKTAKSVASKNTISRYGPCKLYVRNTDILCYLLSLMTPEKRRELFQANPYDVSACFLMWPWQDLFLDVAQFTLESITEHSYCFLLENICSGINVRSTKVDIFRKFFQCSPVNLKSYFVDQECLEDGEFLFKLFAEEELEIIECIFRNIEVASQFRLLCSEQGHYICYHLMYTGKWNLLNFFIEKAVLSPEHREQLKENLMSYFCDYFKETELRCKLEKWEQSFFVK